MRRCYWSLEVLANLSLGSTRSHMTIDGETVVTPPLGPAQVYPQGAMLALPTNMGTLEQTAFTVIPELGVNVGLDLTCRMRATFGYSLLYWSRVARPGDMIDTDVNPTQFPTGSLEGFPAPRRRCAFSDYWAQGLSIGLDYRF